MLAESLLAQFQALLGPERARADADTLALYASDETPRSCPPEAVLFPTSHEHVVEIVRLANRHRLALTGRGAGSGNVGGAMPVPGSVVVSFECMQRIVEIDVVNRLVVVEPGVVTDEIDRLARNHGLMYAPDPGSGAYCRIGGNLAMNAAGPRAVKYGATRDHVLGLTAVTGDGRVIHTGGRTTKYATAYDLTRLLVGSEGTLAFITQATLKLLPAPAAVATLRVCYASNQSACEAVSRVMNQPITPCALEFMDRRSLDAIRDYGDGVFERAGLPSGTQAVLMVEADGDPEDVPRQIVALEKALAYMDLKPGTPMTSIPVDVVFIGSCTNGRIEDLREAAGVLKGRKVAPKVQTLVVPGSARVKAQAEAEGLDKIFTAAGAEWRNPGCSMCLAMNPDRLKPGQRSASTSNRNFEGRQGQGGRTHLVSPVMAAAAAVAGHFVDVRKFLEGGK